MVRERCSWERRVSRRRVLGRGCPAHLGRSRDLRAVIPAQAGIHTSWERGRPARNTPKAWVVRASRSQETPAAPGIRQSHHPSSPGSGRAGSGQGNAHDAPDPRPAGRPHHHHRRELQRHAQDQGDQPARAGGGRPHGHRLHRPRRRPQAPRLHRRHPRGPGAAQQLHGPAHRAGAAQPGPRLHHLRDQGPGAGRRTHHRSLRGRDVGLPGGALRVDPVPGEDRAVDHRLHHRHRLLGFEDHLRRARSP